MIGNLLGLLFGSLAGLGAALDAPVEDRSVEPVPTEDARIDRAPTRASLRTRTARVSVVIPTRNRSALLADAIRSVRALEGPDLDLEILVVDNGSTDDTVEVAMTLGARVLQATTVGPSAARNTGIRAATGAFIAFLDDDDVWLSGHLRPQLALLDARPDLSACIGQIVPMDAFGWPTAAPYPASLPANGDVFEAFLTRWPQIGALVVRSSVRESVGYLDESLSAGEDWDWLLRIALQHRVGHVAVPSVLFRSRPIGTEAEDATNLARVRINRQVFWRNVWRARGRGLSPWRTLRTALRYDGIYAGYFLRSGALQAAAGDRSAARRSLARALRISPLHVGWSVTHNRASLLWIASTLLSLPYWG